MDGEITLRPHQMEAVSAAESALRAGESPLVVMPTGTGKTFTFIDVIKRTLKKNQRALVLAHRLEIIEQIATSCEQSGLTVDIEQGTRRARMSSSVVVASVQTMRRTKARWRSDAFSLIVIDEAHHAAADSYRKILSRFECPVMGVTATPDRFDKKTLGTVFDRVAVDLQLPEAVQRKLIVPIVQRTIKVDSIDISRVKDKLGDLSEKELGDVLVGVEQLQGVAIPLLGCIGERRTIAFTATVDHAQALTRVLNGISPGIAECVSGEDTASYRAGTLSEFEAGRFQILVNCALFTEGFDSPGVSCIAMARPTKSRGFYQQCIGRGTRLAEGKHNLLVLDFCGNTGRHELVTAIDLFARPGDSAKVIADAKEIASRDPEAMMAAHVALELARQLPGEVIEAYTVSQQVDAAPAKPVRPGECVSCRRTIVGRAVPSRGDAYCHRCWLNAADIDANKTCMRCKINVTKKAYVVSRHRDTFCNSCWATISRSWGAEALATWSNVDPSGHRGPYERAKEKQTDWTKTFDEGMRKLYDRVQKGDGQLKEVERFRGINLRNRK